MSDLPQPALRAGFSAWRRLEILYPGSRGGSSERMAPEQAFVVEFSAVAVPAQASL
jgi:hypothetical protein